MNRRRRKKYFVLLFFKETTIWNLTHWKNWTASFSFSRKLEIKSVDTKINCDKTFAKTFHFLSDCKKTWISCLWWSDQWFRRAMFVKTSLFLVLMISNWDSLYWTKVLTEELIPAKFLFDNFSKSIQDFQKMTKSCPKKTIRNLEQVVPSRTTVIVSPKNFPWWAYLLDQSSILYDQLLSKES